MRKLALASFALAALAAAGSAQLFWSGSIDSADPTFNRPLVDGSVLSGVGTAVGYDVQMFHVLTTGAYRFESGQTWDGFILVYANNFNPAASLTNYQAGNDDYFSSFAYLTGSYNFKSQAGAGSGAGSMNLTAGVQYYAVTTSFLNSGTGRYDNAIGGPGTVVAGAVPEPATLAALGLGAIAMLRRRRK